MTVCNSKWTSFNQNWEENSAGTCKGRLELTDSVLQEQLFRWIQTSEFVFAAADWSLVAAPLRRSSVMCAHLTWELMVFFFLF